MPVAHCEGLPSLSKTVTGVPTCWPMLEITWATCSQVWSWLATGIAMTFLPRSAATFSIAGPGAVNVGTADAFATVSLSSDRVDSETAVPPLVTVCAPQADTHSAAATRSHALRQRITALLPPAAPAAEHRSFLSQSIIDGVRTAAQGRCFHLANRRRRSGGEFAPRRASGRQHAIRNPHDQRQLRALRLRSD